MARRYRRRYYDNDENEALGVFFLWIIFSIINFIKQNYQIILIGLLFVLILSLLIILIKKRKEIKLFIIKKIDNKRIKKLKNKSQLYLNILRLNNKYKFDKFTPFYDQYYVRHKADFLNCNIDDYLLMTINDKYENLKKYKTDYDLISNKYKQYEKEYKELEQYINNEEAIKLNFKIDEYNKYQLKILNDNKLKNDIEFKIVIYINYRSNKGKVKKNKYRVYDKDLFSKFLNDYFYLKKQNKIYEISSRVERARMSESLRYDVFKRDDYKCQICGAGAKDGANLQVDHIIPVSKGGKTEISNLQTLCSRCNLGKSNKM